MLDFICIFWRNELEQGISPKAAMERLISFMDDWGVDVGALLPITPYISNEYVYRVVAYERFSSYGIKSNENYLEVP